MNIRQILGLLSVAVFAMLTACGGGSAPAASTSQSIPPSVTSPSVLPNGVVSTPYTTSLTANGGTAPYSWAIKGCSGVCDASLTLSQAGVFSGTPANAGTSMYMVGVTDAMGQTASATLTLTIAPPPVSITTSGALPDGVASTPYSASLTATGGTTPYSWTIKSCSGVCDPNLSLSQAGVFSGTPANAGTSTYNVTVTDAKGQSASVALTLTIAVKPLSITSSGTLPNGVVSNAYSASLTATGGTLPYSWVIKGCSGLCDPNLSLSQAGVLSGTPFNSGSSSYNVTVMDAAGQAASTSMSLNVTPNSFGANYFVSPSGSDSNPCSQTSPCATPDHAFNLASGGQTVRVSAGTYDYGSGTAIFKNSGTAGNNITVTCATRGACKIQSAPKGNTTVVELDGDYTTFDGFEVTGTNPAGNNLGIYVTSSFVKITRNTVHHIEIDCSDQGGGGIATKSSAPFVHDITVDSNLIWDIGWPDGGSPKCTSSAVQADGILMETPGANIVVTNNIVYHVSGGWGISAGGSKGQNSAPSIISNNLVFANADGGITITNGGDSSTVTNNIILDNGTVASMCGISTIYASDDHIVEANNDVYGNAGGDYCSAGHPMQTNNISVDPGSGTTFVNWQADGSGDYHEKSGSPTIDSGTSSTGAPAHDFDGNPRPQGTGYDIGPYEFSH